MTDVHSEWPEAVEIINARGRFPVVLLCPHASNYIPAEYDGLGLASSQLQRHIAWDIGADGVTRRLSALLDAPAFIGTYSRLLIDLNRPLRSASSMVRRSEMTDIPGNASIPQGERERRIARIFEPYHEALAAHLDERAAARRNVVIVGIHSFTPIYHGKPRQWHAGVLFQRATRFAQATLERLRSNDTELSVGANVPYAITAEEDCGVLVYGDNIGNPALVIEIRQDLVVRPADQAAWAERLAVTLAVDVALEGPAHASS